MSRTIRDFHFSSEPTPTRQGGFIEKGWVKPAQPPFIDIRITEIRRVAADRLRERRELDRRNAEIFRDLRR
jgi:hypothetical protein